MKIRILLALLVPLALLIATGVYYKRSSDAEVLYQHHWRQELGHLLAIDRIEHRGDDFVALSQQQNGYVPFGKLYMPTESAETIQKRDALIEHHTRLATDHRRFKERYERIMHRPWTSGD